MKFDKELDVRDVKCPLHILRLRKAIMGLDSGQVLKIRATDPGSEKDFRRFSSQTGHRLVSTTTSRKELIFFIRKA